MAEQDMRSEGADEDVEGHLIKEALATGVAAGALIAGTGAAQAANTPDARSVQKAAPRQVLPGEGGSSLDRAAQLPPGDSGPGAAKAKKAARPAKHGRK